MHPYYYDQRPWQEPPTRPDPPPRRRGRGRIVVCFVCFLALIGGITAAILLLDESPRWSLSVRLPQWEQEEQRQWPAQPTDTPQQTAPQLPRAALGDGTVLQLYAQPEGEGLSYQQIYQDNVQSIVSVRAYLEGQQSLGTGVICDEKGYIITNAHVIEGSSRVDVVLWDESVYSTLLVGQDVQTDLAVLKIEAEGLRPAVFGDSAQLEVGDTALAIGNPLGEELRGTMTDGIISAINRDVAVDGRTMTLIQTTAALNSGNSGGALINQYGQVVGITNLKMYSYYDTVEGLGFAIPSTTVKAVVDELIASGHVNGRPTIGILGCTVTADMAREAGTPTGVKVDQVQEGSDAWGKLEAGDVIVQAQGEPVEDMEQLQALKNSMQAGQALALQVWRQGEYLEITVTLVESWQLEE